MKKWFVLVVVCLLVIVMLLAGCSAEMGYILRDDIAFTDLAFIDRSSGPGSATTISDMYSVLGLPHEIGQNVPQMFWYYFEDETYSMGVISFTFSEEGELLRVDVDTQPMDYDLDVLDDIKVAINRNKYQRAKRFDISEDDLVIDGKTTSAKLQDALGAPHGSQTISIGEPNRYLTAYYYTLTNKDVLYVVYGRSGFIAKAWIGDKDGNEMKVFLNRVDSEGRALYE